jgi:glycosyltransferase involved in cell wall biosynthesis
MKAVTVHRGSRDGYQVARALSEAGLLETLVTDLYWPADRPWARKIEQRAPASLRAALKCRWSEGLPSRAVESCWLTGMAAYLAHERNWLSFDSARRAIRRCDGTLGRRAGRIARDRNAAILAYSYYGHSAFSCHGGDQPRILFQLHPHPSAVRSILQRERRLHPDCAVSLDKEWELALPEADYLQLVNEAGMAHRVITASNFTKSTLVDAGIAAERIAVVPYGIDADRYSRGTRTRGPREPLRLLFVGTLGQRKGIKYLIQALEMLPRDAVELTVCGRAVDDLEIFHRSSARIRLLPSVSAEGLLEAYRNADVFVFPSLAEGFAQVILEALASGLAVIATTRTAAPDLIRHGREGFIIEPGSAAQMALHIEEFLRLPEILAPMRAAARRRAEHFSWGLFRQEIAKFVGGVLNPASSVGLPSVGLPSVGLSATGLSATGRETVVSR